MSGLRPGWKRIASDQIVFKDRRVRILKLTFKASGGGVMYVISYMEKYKGGPGQDIWCRHKSSPQDLAEAYEIAEKLHQQLGK